MAHINNLGSGMFSDISVVVAAVTNLSAYDTEAEFTAAFPSTAIEGVDFVRIKNVRTFPSIGTPANIVRVPEYGSKTSKQIQGQADAPSLELAVNYIPSDYALTTPLGVMVGDGKMHVFRFSLLNTEPVGYLSTIASIGTSKVTGAIHGNTLYYWVGKIEALLVSPQLTDTNTATLSLSTQSSFFGAFTL